MVSMLDSSAVDHGFEPRSGQTKDNYHGENKLIFNEMVMMSACTRTTRLAGFFIYSTSSLKQQSADRHVAPTRIHYPEFEPTSHCCVFCGKVTDNNL
jgi:hypothetical protein